jgi:acetolactate synthase small subunit
MSQKSGHYYYTFDLVVGVATESKNSSRLALAISDSQSLVYLVLHNITDIINVFSLADLSNHSKCEKIFMLTIT